MNKSKQCEKMDAMKSSICNAGVSIYALSHYASKSFCTSFTNILSSAALAEILPTVPAASITRQTRTANAPSPHAGWLSDNLQSPDTTGLSFAFLHCIATALPAPVLRVASALDASVYLDDISAFVSENEGEHPRLPCRGFRSCA